MPDASAGFYSAHAGNIHVQQHCIKLGYPDKRQCLFAPRRIDDDEAHTRQRYMQSPSQRIVIVDDKNGAVA
jgi:hypothetical protein